MNQKSLLTLLPLLFSLSSIAYAQSTYLKVGDAKTKKPVVAITTHLASSDNEKAQARLLEKTILSDLEFTDLFRMLPASGFPQTEIKTKADLDFSAWAKTGADYTSFGSFRVEGSKAILEFRLVNIGGNNEVIAKRYNGEAQDIKILAHSVANDIYQAITGKRGIFLTKLAFVCDKTGKKEIYTANFDGSDVRQITRLRSLTLNPSWSPDGTKIAFSVYNRHSDNTKNIDLFEYSFATGGMKLLSNRKGINSGASYSPTGKQLAYTMSYTGNPDIHVLDLETKTTTQLTKSIGFDVDPAWSPDGSQIAFVSSRPGKPMLYLMNASASSNDAKRLTYAGSFNATPSWSPDSKKIAFAGWLDNRFDLFTITADGGKIDRLTKNEGNNEDPSFSPDGNFITFSSSRSGGKNIFMMNTDGGNVKRLTFSLGNCVAPKWSPYL